jgi:hypothetical protein
MHDRAPQSTTTTTRLTNATAAPVKLVLEPWGDEFPLAGRASVDVLATGPSTGFLEVTFAHDRIVAYGWSGSIVRVFQEGLELGDGAARAAVPPIP